MRQAIEKNAKLLALFAVGATALVATVHWLTFEQITHQQQQYLVKTLAEVVNPDSHDNDMTKSCIIINDEALSPSPQKAYLAFLNEQPVAAAITTLAPDGYNGNIELLVAVNNDGLVQGVRTLKHSETPGLGDKIEIRRSNWILSFNQQSIVDENDPNWAVRKDGGMFDQFTGATITPRAVVNAVKRTTLYFNKHKQTLFTQASQCQESK